MKLRLAFALVAVAIGLHFYLTNHYYELSMGVSSSDSVCNVSESFNCDTTSASKFATLLGIPIAAWGAATNGILLILIFGWMLRWTDDLAQLSRYTYYLSGFTAVVSIVMGIISSVVLGAFCLFCMGTYLVSWLVFGLLHFSLEEDDRKFTDHLTAMFGPAKIYAGFLLAIPVAAFLMNAGVSKKYGAGELEKYIRASLADWRSSPSVDLSVAPSMVKGASDADAKFVISEFADFRCGHCKHASPSLNAFVSARKEDVQLRFYNFPLDKSCNDAIGGGDGVSCLLAKAVTCAEKMAQKGWQVHDSIFEEQTAFQGMSLPKASERIGEIATSLSINVDEIRDCMVSDEVNELVKAQAQAGKDAGVRGTPSIYVNGRRLPRGQAIPVLQRAYKLTTNQ